MLTPRFGASRFFAILAIILSLGLGQSGVRLAFGEAPNPTAAPTAVEPAVKKPGSDVEKPSSTNSLWKLFVPFSKLKDLVSAPSGTVFLTNEQFEELWKAAGKATQSLPETASLTSAVYTATTDDQNLAVRGTLSFHSSAESWSRLRLDFGAGKLSEIKWIDAGPVVIRSSLGETTALIPAAGTYRGEFEIIFPLNTRGGEVSGEIRVPPAPVSSLQVTLNRAGVVIRTRESFPTTPLPPVENASSVKISLGSESFAHIFWPAAQATTAPDQRMISALQKLVLRFAPGKAFVEGTIEIQRQRGDWGQVQLSLPKGAKVLDLRSPAIKRWNLAAEGEKQLVNIELTNAAGDLIEGKLLLEFPVLDSELGNISFSTVGAVRESGYLTIAATEDLDVSIQSRLGLISESEDNLPEGLQIDRGEYFRFYSPDYELKLAIQDQKPRIRAESLTVLRVSDQEIRIVANFSYRVERVGLFSASFTLSEGLEITKVQSETLREYGVTDDGRRLDVQFSKKLLGDGSLTVEGRLKLAEGTSSIDAPSIEPIGVNYEEGRLHVAATESLEIATDATKVVGLTAGSESVPVEGGWREASSWIFNSRPIKLPLTMNRKPPRVIANVATSVVLRPKFAEVRSIIKYDVAYSGVSQFVVRLPDLEGVNVRIEGEGDGNLLKQVTPAPEATEGWKEWTLQAQREVLGPVAFVARYDIPIPEAGESGIAVSVQPPRLLAAAGAAAVVSAKGEMTVKADDQWSLSATTEGVDEIDVRELESLSSDASLAYRYFESPNPAAVPKISLKLEKLDRKDVVRTIVSRGLVEIVLTYDSFAYYRCRYRITSSERQRLGIKLPTDVEPLHLAVAGKTKLLERSASEGGNKGFYYINVDRETPADQEFDIQLTYRARVTPILKRWIGGTVKPDLPRIGVTAEGETPAVQEQRLTIWTPNEIELVGSPPDFQLVHAQVGDRSQNHEEAIASEWENWIQVQPAASGDFPIVGQAHRYRGLGNVYELSVQWWRWNWIVMLISVAFLLASWVVRKTTWNNRISLVLITAFLMLLVGSGDWDLLRHLFYASRLGVVVVIVIWGLGELKRWSAAGAFGRSDNPGGIDTQWGKVLAPVIPPPGTFKAKTESISSRDETS